MKALKFALIVLTATALLGGSQASLASGYGSCDLEAILLCNEGPAPGENAGAAELKFRIVGTPQCKGLGTQDVKAGRLISVSVEFREDVDVDTLKPGAQVRLRYNYMEGITPEGVQISKRWLLTSVDQPVE